MRATIMYKAGDVRIENVPDASIQNPTDAVIRVTRACICGSDLWPYNLGPAPGGPSVGHEAIGIVEEVEGRRDCQTGPVRRDAVRLFGRHLHVL